MQIVRTVTDLRAKLAHASGVGFVPTMGALHDGHLSLVRASREHHEVVVMSIFVNPKQFEDGGDFSSYPRDESRDLELARAAGVDLVFIPNAAEIYPQGFATTISVDTRLTGVLEGAVRGAEHFSGMATVVAKLLIAVAPDAAYFGAKDFQQLLIVKRLVTDLGLPVRVVGCPTLRESDGLALSSRNAHLSPEDRRRARAIFEALTEIANLVGRGEREVSVLQATGERILLAAGLEIEYLAFVHPDTLQPIDSIISDTVCAIAVATASTRLIDNELLKPPKQ